LYFDVSKGLALSLRLYSTGRNELFVDGWDSTLPTTFEVT